MALCVVIYVVFPVDEWRERQDCWAGASVSHSWAVLGVARLRAAVCVMVFSILRIMPPRWLQNVSDPS